MPTVYIHITNELIDTMSYPPATGDGWVEYTNDNAWQVAPGCAYYMGVIYFPGDSYHVWDLTTHQFILDQVLFTPYFTDQISAYRDTQTAVTVSYNNGTITYNVTNDDRTRSALLQKAASLQLQSDTTTYNFKTDDGFFELGVGDLQGLFLACDLRQQKCFDAQELIMSNHSTTPYTSIEDAEADFDTFLAS